MQSLAVVVLRKIICNTIKRESAAADTIGYSAYCSTKETFTGIVDISFPITIANYDIVNVAVSVRSERLMTRAPKSVTCIVISPLRKVYRFI